MSIERLHNEAALRANMHRLNDIIARELDAKAAAETAPLAVAPMPDEIDGEHLAARHAAKIQTRYP